MSRRPPPMRVGAQAPAVAKPKLSAITGKPIVWGTDEFGKTIEVITNPLEHRQKMRDMEQAAAAAAPVRKSTLGTKFTEVVGGNLTALGWIKRYHGLNLRNGTECCSVDEAAELANLFNPQAPYVELAPVMCDYCEIHHGSTQLLCQYIIDNCHNAMNGGSEVVNSPVDLANVKYGRKLYYCETCDREANDIDGCECRKGTYNGIFMKASLDTATSAQLAMVAKLIKLQPVFEKLRKALSGESRKNVPGTVTGSDPTILPWWPTVIYMPLGKVLLYFMVLATAGFNFNNEFRGHQYIEYLWDSAPHHLQRYIMLGAKISTSTLISALDFTSPLEKVRNCIYSNVALEGRFITLMNACESGQQLAFNLRQSRLYPLAIAMGFRFYMFRYSPVNYAKCRCRTSILDSCIWHNLSTTDSKCKCRNVILEDCKSHVYKPEDVCLNVYNDLCTFGFYRGHRIRALFRRVLRRRFAAKCRKLKIKPKSVPSRTLTLLPIPKPHSMVPVAVPVVTSPPVELIVRAVPRRGATRLRSDAVENVVAMAVGSRELKILHAEPTVANRRKKAAVAALTANAGTKKIAGVPFHVGKSSKIIDNDDKTGTSEPVAIVRKKKIVEPEPEPEPIKVVRRKKKVVEPEPEPIKVVKRKKKVEPEPEPEPVPTKVVRRKKKVAEPEPEPEPIPPVRRKKKVAEPEPEPEPAIVQNKKQVNTSMVTEPRRRPKPYK